MNENDNTNPSNLTAKKIALIAFLSITLIAVIVAQLASPAATAASTTPYRRPAKNKSTSPKENKQNMPAPMSRRNRQWPMIALAETQSYNPFRLLPAMIPPEKPETSTAKKRTPVELQDAKLAASEIQSEKDKRQQVLAKLRTEGVSLIVLGNARNMAKIGSRDVQIGDELDGFIVKDINAQGIVLIDADTD